MLILLLLLGIAGGFLAMELREGRLQARIVSAIAEDLDYTVGLGASDRIRFPQAGPYDTRMGYTALPDFTDRLTEDGAVVRAQARWSSRMLQLTDFGLFPVYTPKSVAGLKITDRGRLPMYDVPAAARAWPDFAAIPPVLAQTLAYVENRELLDPQRRHRNPAVEWDRFAYAVSQAAVRVVKPGHKVPGASTLATQMEKYQHSPGGQTADAQDKLRQMASATFRAYLDGPDTRRARQNVLRDYLNGVPLAAVQGHGEVHGFGDALWAYFGTDFDVANRLLAKAHVIDSTDPELPEVAHVYRQSVGLVLSLRRPMRFLKRDRAALAQMIDHHLGLLADAGVISAPLRDAALHERLTFMDSATPEPTPMVDRKGADAIRLALLRRLDMERLYDLDRLDLTVRTTFDAAAQQAVSQTLAALQTPDGAAEAGLYGRSLLKAEDDPAQIEYSFSLYERVGGVNAVRIHTDSHAGPFSLNDGMKLELGSTAKLRTLVTWLELIAEAYDRQRATHIVPHEKDALQRWVAGELKRAPDLSLADLLDRALDRRFSADPRERFFTGGGLHRFHNFDPKDDFRRPTVRRALERSVNLPFVRMMREVVQHLTYQQADAAAILADEGHPARHPLLARFAQFEGRIFLRRFLNRYKGMDADSALDVLSTRAAGDAEKLAILHRTARPDADIETFALWVQDRADTPLEVRTLVKLYERVTRFNLQDRGYVTGVHPLELWAVAQRHLQPKTRISTLVAEADAPIQAVYRWLFEQKRTRKQNTRIRIMLEQDAFAEVHRRWRAVGFPFEKLVPSYGSALGSSGDRPTALAELMGILSAGGLKHPTRRITRYHFAAGTPFETVIDPPAPEPVRVLPAEVAAAAKAAVLGVVAQGTARRAKGAFGGGALVLGGKTGTGDNRSRAVDKRGNVIKESVRNRTATLTFMAGDRWFGVVTAYVPGAQAGDYRFTSALPTQVLKHLAPKILPAFGVPGFEGESHVALRN
jgi:membrane peptidoglycan carboxypeptidase